MKHISLPSKVKLVVALFIPYTYRIRTSHKLPVVTRSEIVSLCSKQALDLSCTYLIGQPGICFKLNALTEQSWD